MPSWLPPRYAEDNHMWKGDEASDASKRNRAAVRYELTDCELCGEPATDRHHKDGNTGNNSEENIAKLCRSCHMRADGRLERLREAAIKYWKERTPTACAVCGEPARPARKGRCSKCSEYFRRNGKDRSVTA